MICTMRRMCTTTIVCTYFDSFDSFFIFILQKIYGAVARWLVLRVLQSRFLVPKPWRERRAAE